MVEPMPCSSLRRWIYTAALFLPGVLVIAPAILMVIVRLYPVLNANTSGPDVNIASPGMAMLQLGGEMALISLVLLVLGVAIGLLGIAGVPRLLRPFLKEERTYALYGVHYFLARMITSASNSRFFSIMFGDSSYIVGYLRWTGWNLNKVEQTGSNFGTGQKHDVPFLCDIGTGTIVSDGLAMSNAEMSSSSFELSKVAIGEHNFLGNNIHFPPRAATGANVLFGTKVMVPIDGPVREDVGLLGSPCFEIPRATEADKSFAVYADADVRAHASARRTSSTSSRWATSCSMHGRCSS